ncbi:MAG: amino acid--tRNA ligase-related protein, partial [Chthonomonadales bacterium]
MTNHTQPDETPDEFVDPRADRFDRLHTLREQGVDPYAVEQFNRKVPIERVTANFTKYEKHKRVRVAGRLYQLKVMGGASFAFLEDETGRIQIRAERNELGEIHYRQFCKLLHAGDILGISGELIKTKTGEITIRIKNYKILALCVRNMNAGKEKDGIRHGALADVEQRYRMRYVDLHANPLARETMIKRIKIVQTMRRYLEDRGFLEVETPTLQQEAGGAAARPFKTHHNALDYDFKLRIALELPLKRLIVGGFEKVYEIGRVYRNEGIDRQHNPEFTLLELYQAYTNLDGMMDLVEKMYTACCVAVNGEPRFLAKIEKNNEVIREEWVDMSSHPWRRLPILEGIREYAGIAPEELTDLASAKAACERVGVPTEKEHTVGGIIEKLH